MTIFLAANNAASQLAASITNVQTTITLAAGTGALFPSPTGSQVFTVTVEDAGTGLIREVMYCTSRTVDTLTVTRGQEGTTAHAFTIHDPVANLFTKGTFDVLAQNPSSATGVVAAVSGSGTITIGNFAGFSDTLGTVQDSGVSLLSVSTPQFLFQLAGVY